MSSPTILSLGLTVIVLTGCQTAAVKEEAPAIAMEPMPRIVHTLDHRFDGTRDGAPHSYSIVSRDGGISTYTNSEGCTWARADDDAFSPATMWQSCGEFDDGTATVRREGEAFPIEVGRRWSYDIQGVSGANSWSRTRDCEVATTARIDTASGTHDTFKVVCSQKGAVRTYYVSPAVGDYVRYEFDRGYKGKQVNERL